MRSINDYLLIKHTPNGRTFPNLDCWGLIVDYYREMLGIQINEYTDLTAANMSTGLMYERNSNRFCETKEPRNGDVIAFFVNARLYHVGIYINGRILHTSQSKNCRFESLDRVGNHQIRFYHYVGN